MDRISLQIKLLYDKMGKAEKRIADWIFENPKKKITASLIHIDMLLKNVWFPRYF